MIADLRPRNPDTDSAVRSAPIFQNRTERLSVFGEKITCSAAVGSRNKAEGYVLACQAKATGRLVIGA